MRASDRAWIAIGVGVLSWDLACEDGDTLSEACDRYMIHHPWLVRGVAFALAAHVCNLVPDRFDPVHWCFTATRFFR